MQSTKKPSSKRDVSRVLRHMDFPVKPVSIQTIKTAKGVMNHSYRDFSNVPPSAEYKPKTDVNEMSFAEKIHTILSRPDEFGDAISWMPHGRAFKVHVPKTFEDTVCQVFFGHHRYSSFLRDLNKHSFKHISKGVDRNCYYHEFMLRGRPWLTGHMPKSKDARRLDADPDNEPDFYVISEKYPVEEPSPAVPAGASNQANSAAGNIISPSPPLDTGTLGSLLSAMQGAQTTQPARPVVQQAVPPQTVTAPQAPLEQLVALASSMNTSAPAPPPPTPMASGSPDLTGVLQALAVAMGGAQGSAPTPTTATPVASTINKNSNGIGPNELSSLLAQMTSTQRKENEVLVNLVNTILQKQREQQEAAKLAVALAMCLNSSGTAASTSASDK